MVYLSCVLSITSLAVMFPYNELLWFIALSTMLRMALLGFPYNELLWFIQNYSYPEDDIYMFPYNELLWFIG